MDFVHAITTLAHLFALQTAPGLGYQTLVILSTLASFVWHSFGGEFSGLLYYLDYGFAGIWFLTDALLGVQTPHFENILFWNCALIMLHHFMTGWWLTLWHLFSAAKCMLVAWMLRDGLRT